MICSGQRAIWNAVAVHVAVPLETSKLFEIFGCEHFPAIESLLWIFEWIGHPVIHAQIEVAHHENRRLESFRKVKRLVTHVETLGDARRQQHDVFCVTMRSINQGQNVGLLGPGRQTCAWPNARDIEDYGWNLGVISKPDEFLH